VFSSLKQKIKIFFCSITAKNPVRSWNLFCKWLTLMDVCNLASEPRTISVVLFHHFWIGLPQNYGYLFDSCTNHVLKAILGNRLVGYGNQLLWPRKG
jgi:hypothetical protein